MTDPDPGVTTRADLYRHTLRHFFGPVAAELFDDPCVNEVLINGPDEVYCERGNKLHRLAGRGFGSERALRAAVNNIAEFVHRRVDDAAPTMDARLPDPYRFRVHVIHQPHTARNNLVVSIRKFGLSGMGLHELVAVRKSITPEAAAYLRLIVETHHNVIVSGGTGAGKTSLLNALSECIPDDERVVVIEDSAELNLRSDAGAGPKPHVVYLEAKPPTPDGEGGLTIRDLFVNSLRMRPDRIVVGECRRGEALDMIQSMLSGHDGAMSTVHASNPALALTRLETLCLMNDVQMPVYVARTQVAQAVQVIVQIARLARLDRRAVTAVAEVDATPPAEGQPYVVRTLFDFDHAAGVLRPTGQRSRFTAELRNYGLAERMLGCGGVFEEDSGPVA